MTTPNTAIEGNLLQRDVTDRLALSIRREKHGPETRRFLVPGAFIRDFEQELLREYAFRRGMPGATIDDLTVEMTPIDVAGGSGSRCSGLRVVVANPLGETFRQEYNVYLFSDVASRAAGELVAEGVLKLNDSYHYELVVAQRVETSSDPPRQGISFRSEPKQAPLQYLTRPLKPMLARAQSVGDPSNDHFPVLYTAEAYERAERFARRGADTHPARETGAVLVGTACSCPDSGEFFVVIADALEATDAKEGMGSLSYTGKTWLRLQTILTAIQSQPDTQTYRFLGQAHGHNFIPGEACDKCAKAKVCTQSSVFVSIDDRAWTQAVFVGVPHVLCHIFGFSARRDRVQGLYSLHDNRLTQRGFHIIPDFNP